jgi:hypothetical protein
MRNAEKIMPFPQLPDGDVERQQWNPADIDLFT